MRFSHKDKKDERVTKQSTYAFEYPQKLDQAPDDQGVFVLLNKSDDVLYIGHSASGSIKQGLSNLSSTNSVKDVATYRWFITKDQQSAETLRQDWIKKYQPMNQSV